MEILLEQFFVVNRTCRLIRDLTRIKLLTILMTKICGWRAFHTARTAKHLGSLSRPRKKCNSFPVKTPSTHSSFLRCARTLWCFNLQQHSFNLKQLVLKICSNYVKFAATLFNLQQLYFICSNFLICSIADFRLAGSKMQTKPKMSHRFIREIFSIQDLRVTILNSSYYAVNVS